MTEGNSRRETGVTKGLYGWLRVLCVTGLQCGEGGDLGVTEGLQYEEGDDLGVTEGLQCGEGDEWDVAEGLQCG